MYNNENNVSQTFHNDTTGEKRLQAKEMILFILKGNEVTLSETRGLFDEILKHIEYTNPITK